MKKKKKNYERLALNKSNLKKQIAIVGSSSSDKQQRQ